MVDFSDLVWANVVGNWISNPGRSEVADNTARQRAKNIQDNFGVQPTDISEYRSKNGGSGFLKGLGIAAAGMAIGGLLALTPLGATAFAVSAIVGAVAGVISMASHQSKVQQGYSNYLDNVAAEGREQSGRGHGQEYSNEAARKHSFSADIAAARQQVAAQGANR
jgi:hypothetical protein